MNNEEMFPEYDECKHVLDEKAYIALDDHMLVTVRELKESYYQLIDLKSQNEALRKERDEIQETLTAVEHEVAKVYCYFTCNTFSKCNTRADVIIDAIETQIERETEEDIKERERKAALLMWRALSTNWTDIIDVWGKTEDDALKIYESECKKGEEKDDNQ